MKNKIIHRVDDRRVGRERDMFAGLVERLDGLNRRQVLKGAAAGLTGMLLGSMTSLLWPRESRADEAVKTGKFIFPRLQFKVNDETKDIWNTGLIGDAHLRKKLRELTNINVSEEAKVVRLSDFDDLCQHPFVFMTSEGSFELPDNEQKNVREFLERGGFIHSDDCVYTHGGKAEDRFFKAYVKLMDKLFPDNPMRKIPLDHELFKIYYEFPKGSPHLQGVDHGAFGLFEPGTGRIMTICTAGDLHCGWMNQWFGEKANLEAMKMGINIIMYFLSH